MAMTGTIKSLVTPTGKDKPTFGFITGDDGADRFFMPAHVAPDSSTQWRDLKEGVPVLFEPTMHDKGARANNVKAVAILL